MFADGFGFVMSAFSSPLAPDLFAAGLIGLGVVGYIARVASFAAKIGFGYDVRPISVAAEQDVARGFFAG